jgi:hypothetical protein
MDEKVEEAKLDNMDDIDVEKELVTINENHTQKSICIQYEFVDFSSTSMPLTWQKLLLKHNW